MGAGISAALERLSQGMAGGMGADTSDFLSDLQNPSTTEIVTGAAILAAAVLGIIWIVKSGEGK